MTHILEERGINTATGGYENFSAFTMILTTKKCPAPKAGGQGHTVLFVPKFHCELNGIERVWGDAKRYTRAYCDYKFDSLRSTQSTVPKGLDSIPKAQ